MMSELSVKNTSFVNSAGQDQTVHKEQSDLGLHLLQSTSTLAKYPRGKF